MLDASFIKKIEDLVDGRELIKEIDGKTFSRHELEEIRPIIDYPTKLSVGSLTAVVEYYKDLKCELPEGNTFIHVASPSSVLLFSTLNEQKRRNIFLEAAPHESDFDFGNQHEIEEFIVMLQTSFIQNDVMASILALVGNIEKSTSVSTEDDGITQKVTAKTGISLKQEATIPNPVTLAPYRTFPEIEQPESPFIFRVTDHGRGPTLSLHEVDDPTWKQETVEKIKGWLSDKVDLPVIG